MATKKSENRKKLVEGCGTILKTNRLKGGYMLVKRKRKDEESTEKTTAPAKRKGRPAKAKTVTASVTAPAKRRGRPAKAKTTTTAMKPSVKSSVKKSGRGRRKVVKS